MNTRILDQADQFARESRASRAQTFRAMSRSRLKYPPRYQVSWGWCRESGETVASFREALGLYRANQGDRCGVSICNLDGVDIVGHDGESGTDILSDGLTEYQRDAVDGCFADPQLDTVAEYDARNADRTCEYEPRSAY